MGRTSSLKSLWHISSTPKWSKITSSAFVMYGRSCSSSTRPSSQAYMQSRDSASSEQRLTQTLQQQRQAEDASRLWPQALDSAWLPTSAWWRANPMTGLRQVQGQATGHTSTYFADTVRTLATKRRPSPGKHTRLKVATGIWRRMKRKRQAHHQCLCHAPSDSQAAPPPTPAKGFFLGL